MLSNFNQKSKDQKPAAENGSKASFKIAQIPVEYNLKLSEMETEAREHLNLALYNFNRMAVIDEEGIENNQVHANQKSTQNYLISAE